MYKSMLVQYSSLSNIKYLKKSLILCFFEYTVQYTNNHKCFIFQFGPPYHCKMAIPFTHGIIKLR